MLIKKFEGNTPKIDPKAFVAETAVVIGKAEMKEYSGNERIQQRMVQRNRARRCKPY